MDFILPLTSKKTYIISDNLNDDAKKKISRVYQHIYIYIHVLMQCGVMWYIIRDMIPKLTDTFYVHYLTHIPMPIPFQEEVCSSREGLKQ